MKTSTFHRTRTLWLGTMATLLSAGILPSALRAQSQDNATPSVAEAARKAKEQKKNSTKDARVITEDTIKLRPVSEDSATAPPAGTVITTNSAASTKVASPATPAAESAKTADTAATSTPPEMASTSAEKKEKSEEAAKAKEMLAQVQAELDVLKRELSLDSDSYYSNPDYSRDTDGRAKLEQLQKMIGDKQVSFDELKKQVEKLLQEAGIPPDTSKAPPQN